MKYLALLRRDRVALGSVVVLGLLVACISLGPLLVPDDVLAQNPSARLQPPLGLRSGWETLLGTDALGRSELARLLIAGRTSYVVALGAAALAATMGTGLGILAGYWGGPLGSLTMRVADALMSFPLLVLAILFLYILQPGLTTIILLLAIARFPLYVRVSRAATLEAKEQPFVDAARLIGQSRLRIARCEIAPVVIPTVVTLLALDVGLLMLLESALSFLGVGIQPPMVSWGVMVAEGRSWIIDGWWLTVLPGLAIFVTALTCNLLANWVRVVTDPGQRARLEFAEAEVSQTDPGGTSPSSDAGRAS